MSITFYKKGVKSRELILQRLQEYSKPADVPTISRLTGITPRNIRYNLIAMLQLQTLYLHHWDKNKSGKMKPFYSDKPNTSNRRRITFQ